MSTDSNVVFIGRKPLMSYVLAVMMHLNTPNAKDVVLKARGRAITTAVDVAEITRRRFMQELRVSRISVGTEELPQEQGRTRAVSTMEITLKRHASVNNKEKEHKEKEHKEDIDSVTPIQPMVLTSITGIGVKRAEKLRSCGISSVQDLAKCNSQDLSEKLQVSEKMVSKWVEEAKKAFES
jgi:DNA-binding protein